MTKVEARRIMEHYDDIVWQDAKGITCGKVKEAFDMATNALKNPWHKVSEELPEKEGTYLLRFWAGCSFQIFIGSYRNGKFGALIMEDGDYVTHWMPIPEVPNRD